MKQRILKFSVCDQRIITSDISVVADSKNYLAALFSFDCTWEGVEKTAVFSQGDKIYNVLLQDDMCRIPAEVITEGEFYVSVFGGDLITADKIAIEVTPSGLLEGVVPPVPTTDIYTQLVDLVSSESAEAQSAAERAEMASQMSQDFAYEAKTYADANAVSVGQVMDGEHAAQNSRVLAEQAAQSAESYANDSVTAYWLAQDCMTEAQSAANRAENAANTLEWKNLLDTTITAEQSGASETLLAIEDAEALAHAKRIRVFAHFPVATAYAANKFWTTITIRDASNASFNIPVLAGNNVAGGANVNYFTMAAIDLSDVGFEDNRFKRTYHSTELLPMPWYSAPANSNAAAKHIAGGYPSETIKKYQPYLAIKFTAGTVTLEEGARIVLEVQ